MIQYGSTTVTELIFERITAEIERKPQWLDIHLKLELARGQSFPEELNDPSALIISTYDGDVIEYVILNEGCDSEFQFTEEEKAQLSQFVKKLVKECIAFNT